MIAIVGWLGALCMVAASFAMPNLLGFYLAVLGLSLLTGQAYDQKNYNLIFLNIASIIGFSTTIWGMI
tara:strand:+ start:281 stop:484 length:204 start_codon:yes stop_codon:yes gene_type:complete